MYSKNKGTFKDSPHPSSVAKSRTANKPASVSGTMASSKIKQVKPGKRSQIPVKSSTTSLKEVTILNASPHKSNSLKATALKAAVSEGVAPVVGIFGGGMAGLSAAKILTESGFKCEVFEARDRLGGRVETGFFEVNGSLEKYERGGELIDNSHIELKQLVQEFRLTLSNNFNSVDNSLEAVVKVNDNGNLVDYSIEDAKKDWQIVWNKYVKPDRNAAGYPTLYYSFTERGQELANTNMGDYIDQITKDISNDYLAQVLKVAYTIEFGGDVIQQSCLNFIYLISYWGAGDLLGRIFGNNSEKFTIREGMSELVSRMSEKIIERGSTIHLSHRVLKFTYRRARHDGAGAHYLVEIQDPSGNIIIKTYDRIIMALPSTLLRREHLTEEEKAIVFDPTSPGYLNMRIGSNPEFGWNVDIQEAGFSDRKKLAFLRLKGAVANKFMFQFNTRFWQSGVNNSNGDTYATQVLDGEETMYQNTWDSSRGQPDPRGILTNFTGGTYAQNLPTTGVDSPQVTEARAERYLSQLAQVLVGADSPFNVVRDPASGGIQNNYWMKSWHRDEMSRGAWSYWEPGSEAPPLDDNQVDLSFTGTEVMAEPIFLKGTKDGNLVETDIVDRICHFAGEYASFEYQGFVQGAVVSGYRAASEALSAFKKQKLSSNL